MKLSFIVLFLFISTLHPTYASCWSFKDRAQLDMNELEGNLAFSIKDAITCKPIVGVSMVIGDSTFSSNTQGTIIIQAPSEIMDASIPITIKSNGYMTLKNNMIIEAGIVKNTLYLMSKVLSKDKVRFVLSWADEPADLDLHITGKDFHVSHKNMGNYQNLVILDVDTDDGYGPETITVNKKNAKDTYRLFVHRYSNEHMTYIDQQVQVSVYYGGRLDRVISLPKTKRKTVEVLRLKNGVIEYINKAVNKI